MKVKVNDIEELRKALATHDPDKIEFSEELQKDFEAKKQDYLNNPAKLQEFADAVGRSVKDVTMILNDLSQPNSSNSNNHETGFWKGSAIVAVGVLIGIAALEALKRIYGRE